jgi:hypothetical protein
MKTFLISASLISASLAALATPAVAGTRWDDELAAQAGTPVRVDEVRLGEELAAHVEDIGQRDLDRLLEELRSDVEAQLAERGLLADEGDADAAELDLTLVMATPNRPTFEQLSGRGDWGWDRPGVRPLSQYLSLSSFGLGNVEVTGVFTGADGAALGEVNYRYEEDDLRQAAFAATWTDAHRGIDMFANRLAETVAE